MHKSKPRTRRGFENVDACVAKAIITALGADDREGSVVVNTPLHATSLLDGASRRAGRQRLPVGRDVGRSRHY